MAGSMRQIRLFLLISVFVAPFLASSATAQSDSAYQAAADALRRGEPQAALDAADAMLRQSPDDPRAIITAADVLLRCGKPDLAVPLYDQYIKARPEAMPQLWQRGIALYFNGQHRSAAQQFVQHREVNPNDVENAAWHFLCVAKAESIERAKQLLLPAPGDPRIPMAEILEMLADGETAHVVERIERLRPETPGRESAIFYGNLYLGLYADACGDQKTALRRMTAAASEAPHHYMGDIARVYAKHLSEHHAP